MDLMNKYQAKGCLLLQMPQRASGHQPAPVPWEQQLQLGWQKMNVCHTPQALLRKELRLTYTSFQTPWCFICHPAHG